MPRPSRSRCRLSVRARPIRGPFCAIIRPQTIALTPPPPSVTGCKAAAADCLVQVVVEGRERVDRKRMAMFFAFGAGYQGCAQYWMLNHWFEWWFTAHRFSTAKKVLAANLIADPVFFFPTFYSVSYTHLTLPTKRIV